MTTTQDMISPNDDDDFVTKNTEEIRSNYLVLPDGYRVKSVIDMVTLLLILFCDIFYELHSDYILKQSNFKEIPRTFAQGLQRMSIHPCKVAIK